MRTLLMLGLIAMLGGMVIFNSAERKKLREDIQFRVEQVKQQAATAYLQALEEAKPMEAVIAKEHGNTKKTPGLLETTRLYLELPAPSAPSPVKPERSTPGFLPEQSDRAEDRLTDEQYNTIQQTLQSALKILEGTTLPIPAATLPEKENISSRIPEEQSSALNKKKSSGMPGDLVSMKT